MAKNGYLHTKHGMGNSIRNTHAIQSIASILHFSGNLSDAKSYMFELLIANDKRTTLLADHAKSGANVSCAFRSFVRDKSLLGDHERGEAQTILVVTCGLGKDNQKIAQEVTRNRSPSAARSRYE
jgi:hypothetical protein